MPDDAARFRKHAFECRRLANDTKDGESRQILIEIAEDLEAEADKTEADESDQSDKS